MSYCVPRCHNKQRSNFRKFVLEKDRRKSFKKWPKSKSDVDLDALAEAGFFYTGEEDHVRCFLCGDGLREWDESHVPWEDHALFSQTAAL